MPATLTGGGAASGWEEAERELAARQAEREHIHRERVVRELTVQAEALAEAVKAAQQLGTVAPQGHSQRATRREDAPARRNATRSRGERAHPPIGGDMLHSPAFEAGSDEPVTYDALFGGGQDDVGHRGAADADTAPTNAASRRRWLQLGESDRSGSVPPRSSCGPTGGITAERAGPMRRARGASPTRGGQRP